MSSLKLKFLGLLMFSCFICFGLAAKKTNSAKIKDYSSDAKRLLKSINKLIDTNYTIPSWTTLLCAKKTLESNIDSASFVTCKKAMNDLQQKNMPYSVIVTINGDPSSRMGFTWYTNANVTGGMVQIVKGNVEDNSAFDKPTIVQKAQTTQLNNINYNVAENYLNTLAGIADNTKKSYVSNKALATGLEENTDYSFRVGTSGAWSRIGHFKTAVNTSVNSFSFIYFTDPQANTDTMFSISAKTTHAAKELFPNANFYLSCGDLVQSNDSLNSEWEYEQFFLTQQDIWYNYPFAPVLGNHDRGNSRNFTWHYNTEVIPFDSALSTTPGSVYSFVYNNTLFIGMSFEDYATPGYLDSLKNWLRVTANSNNAVRWKIAFFHQPFYTGSKKHQSDEDIKIVRDSVLPLFDSLHIDLALQGHDHIYEVIGPLKNCSLVPDAVTGRLTVAADSQKNVTGFLGGTFNVTEGTLYFLNNSSGKKKYFPRSKGEMDTEQDKTGIKDYFSFFTGRFGQTREPTFSNIAVSADSINISSYTIDDSGKPALFDAFKIIKKSNNNPHYQ